jgi:hypothetical protein
VEKVENALIWKLFLVVEQHFRRLNAPHPCGEVYTGIGYRDGVRVMTQPRERAAARRRLHTS